MKYVLKNGLKNIEAKCLQWCSKIVIGNSHDKNLLFIRIYMGFNPFLCFQNRV